MSKEKKTNARAKSSKKTAPLKAKAKKRLKSYKKPSLEIYEEVKGHAGTLVIIVGGLC